MSESVPRRLLVHHITRYSYEPEVRLSHAMVMLRPASFPDQYVNSATLVVDPAPDTLIDSTDPFGNVSTWVSIERPHDHLTYDSTIDVMVTEPRYDFALGNPLSEAVAAASQSVDPLVRWLHMHSPAASSSLPSLPGSMQLSDRSTLGEALWDLLAVFGTEFVFDPSVTTVSTPVDEVLAKRRGVCQDFAHVALVALRRAGLSARYISGYIETSPPPGQKKLVGADASHAWVAVWSGNSWIEIDPTNQCFATTSHVRVASGRDYLDVAPVRGVTIGVPHVETLDISVDTAALPS